MLEEISGTEIRPGSLLVNVTRSDTRAHGFAFVPHTSTSSRPRGAGRRRSGHPHGRLPHGAPPFAADQSRPTADPTRRGLRLGAALLRPRHAHQPDRATGRAPTATLWTRTRPPPPRCRAPTSPPLAASAPGRAPRPLRWGGASTPAPAGPPASAPPCATARPAAPRSLALTARRTSATPAPHPATPCPDARTPVRQNARGAGGTGTRVSRGDRYFRDKRAPRPRLRP
jgi:hypothetical protein